MPISLTTLDQRLLIVMIACYAVGIVFALFMANMWVHGKINAPLFGIGLVVLYAGMAAVLYLATKAFDLPIESFYQALFWMFNRK